ncbi:TIR domain-containing protein [Mesorhizobium sp. URHB0026]
MSKPKIFVGSSRENMGLARAIQEALDYDAEVVIWDQGTFGASEYPLESLEAELDLADFGIFVFVPDDVTLMRGEQRSTIRDNVIFELGLFVGRLGRKRTFIVCPRDVDMHLPSDLQGLTPVDYDPKRLDENMLAAIGPAAGKIRTSMRTQGKRAQAASAGIVQTAENTEEVPQKPATAQPSSPEPSWTRQQYERAFMWATFSHQDAQQAAIDSGFRASPLADSEESIAVWEAWCAYISMIHGKAGTLSSIREKSSNFPKNDRLMQFLGRALARYGDAKGAIEAFGKALENAPDIKAAASAIEDIVEHTEASETHLEIDKLRSRVIAFQHDQPEQRRSFESAMSKLAGSGGLKEIAQSIDEIRIKNEPDDGALRFNVAYAHGNDSPDLAMLHYERIPVSERNGMTWNNLGAAYSQLQLLGSAVEAYELASKNGETLADSNLAHTLLQAGFFEDAKRRLEAAVKVENHHERVIEALADMKAAKSDEEQLAKRLLAVAEKKHAFLERLGEASLQTTSIDIVGWWITPEGVINIREEDDGSYSGHGEFQRPANSLFGLTLSTQTKQIVETSVEIRLRRFGNAFEGTINRRPKDGSTASLLASYASDKKIVLFIAGEGANLRAQLQTPEREVLEWSKQRPLAQTLQLEDDSSARSV